MAHRARISMMGRREVFHIEGRMYDCDQLG